MNRLLIERPPEMEYPSLQSPELQNYVEALEDLAQNGRSVLESVSSSEVEPHLNGQTSRELRRVVELGTRRQIGSFFTTTAMSRLLVGNVRKFDLICDPMCGAGDLLLAAARSIGCQSNLERTLELWTSRLIGTDYQDLFVRLARARLILLARTKTRDFQSKVDFEAFANIRQANLYEDLSHASSADLVLLNPPFGQVPTPKLVKFATGLVSEASLAMHAITGSLKEGASLRAILPDVLRTGSRYQKWRTYIDTQYKHAMIRPLGQFDEHTDVDVFAFRAVRGHSITRKRWWPIHGEMRTLSSLASVSCGTVVPHRDVYEGTGRPYLTSKSMLGEVVVDSENLPTLKHSGKAWQPPFLAVRRTSRPDQAKQLNYTLLTGKREIFVENHVLIIVPNEGVEIQLIKKILDDPRTTSWLGSRIRCRHLTVRAIREIPAWRDLEKE